MKWSETIAIVVMCTVVAAGTAFYVARTTHPTDTGSGVSPPMPPVELSDRQTVALSSETILPVVSANGSVVQDGEDWLLEAPAPTSDLAYRLLDPPVGVKALINGGPSGFTCEWAGLGQPGALALEGKAAISSSQLQPGAVNVSMRCRIPDDVRVVAGLTGVMVLQMDKPTEVEALPLTSVLGSFESGQVVVVNEDGTTTLRQVVLGISDVYNIEVISGLEPDEEVLLYPTQSDFSQAQQSTSS